MLKCIIRTAYVLFSLFDYFGNLLYILDFTFGGNQEGVVAVYDYYVVQADCCYGTLASADVGRSCVQRDYVVAFDYVHVAIFFAVSCCHLRQSGV